MTSFVFRETLMTHLFLWGNAYAQIIRNGKGEVVALYPLMPNRMTVDRDADGQLYYEYQTSQDEAHTMKTAAASGSLQAMCSTFPALALTACGLQPDCDGKERHRHGDCL
jgi:phage portal protein BeeE